MRRSTPLHLRLERVRPRRPTARASRARGSEAQGWLGRRAPPAPSPSRSTAGSAGCRASRGRLTCSDTSFEATSRRYRALRELPDRGSTIRVSTVGGSSKSFAESRKYDRSSESTVGLPSLDDRTTARPRRRGPRDVDHLARPQAGHDRPDRLDAVALAAAPVLLAEPLRLAQQPPVLVEVAEIACEVRPVARRAPPGRARAGAPAATTPRSARNCANDELSSWCACSRL